MDRLHRATGSFSVRIWHQTSRRCAGQRRRSQNPHPVFRSHEHQPHFSPDGQFIYFIADDDGTQNLCRIPVAGGEITRPIGGRLMVNDYNVGKTGDIAAQVATIDRPDEIFTVPDRQTYSGLHTSTTRCFRNLSCPMANMSISKVRTALLFAGYLYKPLDYISGKKVPTILRPHGGPVWAYYAEFSHLRATVGGKWLCRAFS